MSLSSLLSITTTPDPHQGSFLSWHRYYTWAFERVLQTECGYNGTQPVRPPLAASMTHLH